MVQINVSTSYLERIPLPQPSDEEIAYTPLPMGGMLETDLTNTTTVTVRNSLVYDKLINDKHRVTLQVGIETNSVKTKGETSQKFSPKILA